MTGHPVVASLVGSGLLLFSLTATAQPPRDDAYYDRPEFGSVQTFFHRVRSDLDRAGRNAYAHYGDASQWDFIDRRCHCKIAQVALLYEACLEHLSGTIVDSANPHP
jgi:hypothetical protein